MTKKRELYAYLGDLVVRRLRSLLRIWSMKMKPGAFDDFSNGGNAIFDIEEPLGATVTHDELAIDYALSHNGIPPTSKWAG